MYALINEVLILEEYREKLVWIKDNCLLKLLKSPYSFQKCFIVDDPLSNWLPKIILVTKITEKCFLIKSSTLFYAVPIFAFEHN